MTTGGSLACRSGQQGSLACRSGQQGGLACRSGWQPGGLARRSGWQPGGCLSLGTDNRCARFGCFAWGGGRGLGGLRCQSTSCGQRGRRPRGPPSGGVSRCAPPSFRRAAKGAVGERGGSADREGDMRTSLRSRSSSSLRAWAAPASSARRSSARHPRTSP